MVSQVPGQLPLPVPTEWAGDFQTASILRADGVSFRALLMAAMMKCTDPGERRVLAWGFPGTAGYLSGAGHHMPLGSDPIPAQAPALEETDLADLAEQLREAMDGTPPAWAPAVIQLIRRRHPDQWDDAVRTAKANDQAKMEM
jgi:hypothetical protein